MTSAPTDLLAFRANVVYPLTGLAGADVGIAPDAAHLSSGGYHVGCKDIVSVGRWDKDYSTRQGRDRGSKTSNDSSALDVGDNWPRGGRAAWLRFNNLLVAQLRAADPALAALRAVNFSPDGSATKRYDTNSRDQGVVDSTDSVYMHTHLEWWRDTAGTAARTRSLARLTQIIDAAIRNVPLGGEAMADDYGNLGRPPQFVGDRTVPAMIADLWAQFMKEASPYDGKSPAQLTARIQRVEAKLDAVLKGQGLAQADIDDLQARPAAALSDEQAEALGDRIAVVLAAHPDTPLGDADKPAIVAAVKQALAEGIGA